VFNLPCASGLSAALSEWQARLPARDRSDMRISARRAARSCAVGRADQAAIGNPTVICIGGTAMSHEDIRLRPRKVLVVEDDLDCLECLALLVELGGHSVETAVNGLQGVQKAEQYRPEIILMGICMPEMNGYEAARRIRAQPWGRRMLLVAVTGAGCPERCLESGFDVHQWKPVDLEVLTGLLSGPLPHEEVGGQALGKGLSRRPFRRELLLRRLRGR
jgi:CheY-like chemotaxis protein